MAEALTDRSRRGVRECLHKRVRGEWGYGADEHLTSDELIREKEVQAGSMLHLFPVA